MSGWLDERRGLLWFELAIVFLLVSIILFAPAIVP